MIQTVKCKDNFYDGLTIGREYIVISTMPDFVKIRNDIGEIKWFPVNLFEEE